MGALTRMRTVFLNWMTPRWNTFPEWANAFAADLVANLAGVTVGPTQLIGMTTDYEPTTPGETMGEIYISNDRTPVLVWIWVGTWRVLA